VLQHIIGSFKEKNTDFQARFAQLRQLFFEVSEKTSLANVDHQRGSTYAFIVFVRRNEPGKRLQHCDGKIIDAEVPKILKRVSRRRHT